MFFFLYNSLKTLILYIYCHVCYNTLFYRHGDKTFLISFLSGNDEASYGSALFFAKNFVYLFSTITTLCVRVQTANFCARERTADEMDNLFRSKNLNIIHVLLYLAIRSSSSSFLFLFKNIRILFILLFLKQNNKIFTLIP